jgi:sugar/nucleoside kinase (ribokinase family)
LSEPAALNIVFPWSENMKHKAAFVGLSTWDLVYLVDHLPSEDEKVVALDAAMNAGGPATNASVTFSHLGGAPLLVSLFGPDSIGAAILDDLRSCKVITHDIAPSDDFHPPVSSAFVTNGSACRAVVSLNGTRISHTAPWDPQSVLGGSELLLVDGHYMDAAITAAQWASSVGIPVVLDAGSWKPGTERLLPLCDIVIASSRFRPPGCHSSPQILEYLTNAGIRQMAITDGERPVILKDGTETDTVPVHPSKGVDTTGAGDVFHGAFCYFLLSGCLFKDALREASKVAAEKCNHLGSRSWLT